MSSFVLEMDGIVQDLWRELADKSVEKSAKSSNDVLPVEILLNLAEKILSELSIILESCLSSR